MKKASVSMLVTALLLFVLAVCSSLTGAYYTKHGNPENISYFDQSFYFLALVLAVIGLGMLYVFLRRRFPSFFEKMANGVERGIVRLFEGIYNLVCKLLHLRRDALYLHGKDESRYYSTRGKKKGKDRDAAYFRSGKWRDMKTNFDRVRFLYCRFVGSLIRSRGYKFRYSKTPDDIRRDIANYLSEENGTVLLVDIYTERRYARDPQVSEEELETCMLSKK